MLKQILKILISSVVFAIFLTATTVSGYEKKIIHQDLSGSNQMTQQMIDFISTLTEEEQNYLKTKKVVTMCNNPNWAPIVFAKDGNKNEMRGIAIDTLKEIEKRLDIKFKNIPTKNWKEGQQYLKDYKVDILPCYIKSPARQKYAKFTRPYLRLPLAIIAAKDKPIVSGLDEVMDKPWTRQKNSGLIPKLQKEYPDMKIIKTSGDIESFQYVNSGKAYFTIATLPVASHVISKNMFNNLQIIGYTDFIYYLHIAVSDDDNILLSVLNKALADISEQRSKEIFRKWVHPSIKEPVADYKLLGQVLIVFLIVVMFLIYRQHLLRKNITKLKIAEKALQKQQYFLQKAQEIGQIGTWELEIKGNNLSWTDENYKIFGIPLGTELTYEIFINCVHPDDRKFVAAKWEAFFTGQPYDIKHRLSVEGKEKWVREKAELVFNERGECIRGIGVTQDITERKHAEEKIYVSEEKYRAMMESTDEAIYICSSDFQIEYMNPAMIKRTGYDASGEVCHKAIHGFDEKCQWCVFEKIRKGESMNHEIVSDKDGKTFHISNSPIFNINGSVSKLAIFRDVTEFKKIESQLRQAQKMESVGTLAGGIAHDFNNILFPILGYSEMLLADIPEDSPFRNGLSQIYTSSLRASELVRQILTFSRQESGEARLMKMQPIIREALKLIRCTIPTTIEISQNINPDCGKIKADPIQIHQIVMNLATNAYHAMEETGGEMKINLKEVELKEPDLSDPGIKTGTYACLSISDTGKGMDNELIRKIFDPFFTTKETGKGTGMGLSVVHGIVKNMNGAIQVYSKLGKGTEFHVYLPLAEIVEKQQVSHTKTLIQGAAEHILLVDDEKAVIEMEQNMLERLGYKVTSRSNSIEALEFFRAAPEKFDLVITDMQMPNMPGDKFAVELTKIRSDIPILLCTGFSEAMSEEKASSLGINGFLLKPIIMKELSHKIHEILDENEN